MSEKKPVPLIGGAKGRICPVCKKPSYSRTGIHPQCAMLQADADRCDEIRAKRKLAVAESSSWHQKKCPQCQLTLHVRQKQCGCGHVFF
jgi:hypothetical protein